MAVSAADPMANPLPVAAVVFPSISSSSVRARTLASSPAISALPPALSAIGPKASVASVMPSVLSMPTAAKPTPYRPIAISVKPPEQPYAATIPATIVTTGRPVENIPTEIPSIIVVAAPSLACPAIPRVGLYASEV